MNEPSANANQFDVFLCHNWDDKGEIRNIARTLEENGIKPWLDEDQIRPGTSWQTALGEQIEHIKSAAVFVGSSGLGPWQNQEIQSLLSQFVNRNCPVIPVILPSAEKTPDLPWTLQNLHWVDFRVAHPDPLKQLIWGITGEKPDDSTQEMPSPVTTMLKETTELFPPQKKKVIEIRLPGKLDEFSAEEQSKLLQSLSSIMEIGDVKLTRAVAGSVRLYLELDPEDADKLHSAEKEGRLKYLGITEVRLYPALPVPPEEEQQSQLKIILDRVKEYWIDGVLKKSLYNEVLISLGKHEMDEAVQPPSKHYVELSKQRSYLKLKDHSFDTIFDATGLLLILGEPGSGKTTTMLDLASKLITRRKDDPKERVPIVLNLSSWKKKLSLHEWITEELSAKYRVPKKIGRSWLKNDYLLLLLDGLDEVKTTDQPDCVAAINQYIDSYKPSGLVVCCRLMEYQWLPERLTMNGAICLELLGSNEVDDFLTSGGQQLAGLRQAMQVDKVLQELSETPLMLSIMSLAFEGMSLDKFAKWKTGSAIESRNYVFNLYIDRMFQRKENSSRQFSKEKVIKWLGILARKMKQHSQSVFMLEGLQPSWLNTWGQRVMYGAMAALIFGGLCGLILRLTMGLIEKEASVLIHGLIGGLIISIGVGTGSWSESLLKNGFMSALIAGLIGGLCVLCLSGGYGLMYMLNAVWTIVLTSGMIGGVGVGSLREIRPIESLRWQWEHFWRNTIQGWKIGSIIGLTSGLILGLIDVYVSGMFFASALLSGLIFGLIIGSISMAVRGMIGGMTDAVMDDKALPNQGIILSLKNAVISLLTFGLSIGLIGGLIFGMSIGLKAGLTFMLFLGGIVGLGGGLNRGGSAVVKHYSLRFILWIKVYTPFNFIKFLDHCSKLILLKKVGGGYMFIHRMFLEHFAEIELSPKRIKHGKE